MSGDGYSFDEIEEEIMSVVAKAIDVDVDDLDCHSTFSEMGVSSSGALIISGDLEEKFDIELSETLAWEYPSVSHLANYIHGVIK